MQNGVNKKKVLGNSGRHTTRKNEGKPRATRTKSTSVKQKPRVIKSKPRVKENRFICLVKNIYKEPKTTTLGLLYLFMMTSMLVYGRVTEAVYIAIATTVIPLLFMGKSKRDE
jgi:hypothetical protein